MTSRVWLTLLGAVALVSSTALVVIALRSPAAPEERPHPPIIPQVVAIDAAEIKTGRLPMERMPTEVAAALETQSEEIVKTAEALDLKQARITGTCAPGSAIRVIGEDGRVSCQHLPRGIVSVAAMTGVPLLGSSRTEPGSIVGGVGRFQSAGESDFLVVPVALPDGAQVTSFSYVFYDGADGIDGGAWLYRSDNVEMAAVSTSGASSDVRAETTERIRQAKVDAAHYAYFIYFQTSTEAGKALMPISASVSFKLP